MKATLGRAGLALTGVLLLAILVAPVEAGGSFAPSKPQARRTNQRRAKIQAQKQRRAKIQAQKQRRAKVQAMQRRRNRQQLATRRREKRRLDHESAARRVREARRSQRAEARRVAATGQSTSATTRQTRVEAHRVAITGQSTSVTRRQERAAGVGLRSNGNLYVLSIEVDNSLVEKGANDPDAAEARRLARVFRRKGCGVYRQVRTRVLLGRRANRSGILRGMTWLRKNMTDCDTALIFITIHGGYDDMGFFGMFPAGFKKDDKAKTAVWGQEVREELLQMKGRKVVLLESCNAEAFLRTPVRIQPLPRTHMICSCRLKESSSSRMGYALSEGLRGAAGRGKRVVNTRDLARYVRRQVRKNSGGKQHIAVCWAKGMPPIPLVRK
jgi:hypothetical protein